ncbi:MAG: response regulator [Anaerolineales bacterium]
MTPKLINILLAEDDPDDRYLISEALDESQLDIRLFIVEDGEELLDYLNHRGKYENRADWPNPNLILLDLNMPRLDGREALKEIKSNPELRRIPVVVLTTSRAEEDVLRTYDIGISGYIPKPVNFTGLLDVMKAIDMYWLNVAQLPPAER